MRRWLAYITLGLMALAATSCVQPLGKVDASPPSPSPDLRNVQNRLDVHYHLNTSATVSAYIQSGNGTRWTVYQDATRPRPGDYVLQFDGTVAGRGANERRVLPDGDYQLVLDVNAGANHQQTQVPLPIRNADSSPPDVTGLSLLPQTISPNFDARDDVTNATFQLAKQANVALFLDKTDANGQTVRLWQSNDVKLPAGEQALTFDGQINGAPIADGQYQLGVRAHDDAGAIVEQSAPLQVEQAGTPDATLVSVRIGPLQIIRGDQVCIDAVVRNTGQVVLRTEGPDPGYVYNSQDTYSSIADHAYVEHAGFWRIGLSSSGSTDTNGATYPYRWGFGHDLQPGEEAPVHGCVQVLNEQDKLVYFASLVQENVAIHSAGAGMVRVDISS